MNIFPEIKELELPFEYEDETQTVGYGTEYLFDFAKREFVLESRMPKEVNGKAAVACWIEKKIRTQKDEWEIYSQTRYGVNLTDLIFGKSYPLSFVKSEVTREITDALIEHPEIKNILEWEFEMKDDMLKVSFTVVLANEENITKEVLLGGNY